MSIHHISWQTTVSGIEDEGIFQDALTWLSGSDEFVNIERTTSYHGSNIHIAKVEISKKSQATKSLARLGSAALQELLFNLEGRIDDDNCIYIRLDLDSLLAGEINISEPNKGRTVKGKAKLELYPGDERHESAIKTIENAIQLSNDLGLPENPWN